ncbi:MAG: GNAT family N-acetyltransferase [Coriobacteriia bacterium]|nr:GNAT family N-acetyltransferase [Coriobacteriia bacterium]
MLIEMMAEFHEEAGHPFDAKRANAAFETLIADRQHGVVWLVLDDYEPVGYVVMTTAYSMQYGGRVGLLNDLFVRPGYRSRGHGSRVVRRMRSEANALDLRALFVQIEVDNAAAITAYGRAGFEMTDRRLMVARL